MSATSNSTRALKAKRRRTMPVAFRLSFSPSRIHATTVQILTVLMFAVACLSVDNFASASNIASILYATSAIGIASVGLSAIAIGGNLFALSLGATAAFASIIFISLIPYGVFPAIIATLAMGTVTGLLQGVAVGRLRCNAIITTIAATSLIAGVATLASGGRTILANGEIEWLGSGMLLPGVPYQALIFIAMTLIGELLMERTRAGRELRLRGVNPQAAELAGLRTERVVEVSYSVCGLAAAAAGILLAAQSGTGNLRVGSDLDFSAIAGMLIGGIAITGGKGRLIDAAVGTLFLAILTNILLVNNFDYDVQLMVKGAAVLAAVTAAALLTRRR